MGPYPLQDDERVLWSGAPQRRQRWFYEHFAMLISVILLTGFFVAIMAVHPDSVEYPFLVFMMSIPLVTTWSAQLRNSRARALVTTYVVTDQRIIFVAQWPNAAEFRWVRLAALRPPRVKTDPRGWGTITFGTGRWTRWPLANQPQTGAWAPFVPELRAIADAPWVADLIRQARPGPRNAPTTR